MSRTHGLSLIHIYILFFTSLGKVHRKKGYQIPEAGRTAKGTNIVNILPLDVYKRQIKDMFKGKAENLPTPALIVSEV